MEVLYTEIFEIWLKGLRARTSILSRIERIEDGNFGDHRSVGGGVSELRVHANFGSTLDRAIASTTRYAEPQS